MMIERLNASNLRAPLISEHLSGSIVAVLLW